MFKGLKEIKNGKKKLLESIESFKLIINEQKEKLKTII